MGVVFILNHSHIFLDIQRLQSKKITPPRNLTIYSTMKKKTLHFENKNLY